MAGKIGYAFDRLNDFLAVLSALIILFVMIAVGTEVVMRTFFDQVTTWVQEISEYSLLFVTFLGAGWVLKRDRHVRMDILLVQFSPKAQNFMNFVTAMLCAIACLIITWYSAKVSWDYYRAGYYFSTPLETPKYLILGIIPVGCFIFLVQFLRSAQVYFKGWRSLRALNKN